MKAPILVSQKDTNLHNPSDTGIDKTKKRAVSLDVIREIRDVKLTKKWLVFARNIFLFSFYTRGMSFVDMAFLKKKDLQNGILICRRNKTGQQLFVKWENPCRNSSINMIPLIHPICYRLFETMVWMSGINTRMRLIVLIEIWSRLAWIFHLLLTWRAMYGSVLPKVKMSLYLSSVRHWGMIRNKPPEFILAL